MEPPDPVLPYPPPEELLEPYAGGAPVVPVTLDVSALPPEPYAPVDPLVPAAPEVLVP